MTGKEIQGLFDRLGRLASAATRKRGDLTSWEYTFPDGETHRYVLRGLKSLEQAEDDLYNLMLWIWNAKDYLKARMRALGGADSSVELMIDADKSLPLCGDIANLLKHAELRRSRSGSFPALGKMSFRAPQEAIEFLTFRAFEVEMHFDHPELVEFLLPVFDSKGESIGDAFEIAASGVASLERLCERVESAV